MPRVGIEDLVTDPPRFELNEETEARLLALFRNCPQNLERVSRKISTARDNTARLVELRRRKEQLQQRNHLLAEAASGEEGLAADAMARLSRAASFRSRSGGSDSAGGPTPSAAPSLSPAAAAVVDSGPVPEDWAAAATPYQYCGPSQQIPGIVSTVFPNGQLFRIVTERNEWAFYNDTRGCEMHVRYHLGEQSHITAAPSAPGEDPAVQASRRVAKTASGHWEASVIVPPEQTVILFSGSVSDYEERCRAVRLVPAGSQGAASPSTNISDQADRALSSEAWEAWAALTAAAGADSLPSLDGLLTADAIAPAAVQVSEQALELCLALQLPFVDPGFFPSYARLFRPAVDAYAVVPLHWRTPRSFLPPRAHGEARLFPGPPSAAAIRGGGALLPDHAVLSVMAALVEVRPAAVVALFTHPAGSAALAGMERRLGAYRVQLCLSGWWCSVLVDSYLPAARHRPEFARCRDDLRALWCPLLEKAYAKASGSYAAIAEAGVPDVVANLTGSHCCSLSRVWPTKGAKAGEGDPAVSAFVDLLWRHVALRRGGEILLRAFPLSLARSDSKRDRLEEIYAALGLVPGTTVLVLAVRELTTRCTMIRLRQNVAAPRTEEQCLAFWRQLKKPWVDALWELDLPSGADDTTSTTGPTGTVWMELADVPQFFQEGFLLYPTIGWSGGEVRAKGSFAGADGTPTTCLKLEVSAPVTVLVSVTLPERRLAQSRRRLAERDGASPYPLTGLVSSLKLLLSGDSADIRGCALQVLARSSDGDGHTHLGCGTSPDIYTLGGDLQFDFQRDAAVAVELLPEHSPYYFVPRISPAAAEAASDVPYVIAVASKATGKDEEAVPTEGLRVSFVEVSASATVLKTQKMPGVGSAALHSPADVKEVAAEYQISRMVGDQRLLVHGTRVDVL